MSELWEKSAAEIRSGYKRGEYSPVEVVDAILKRCEKINPLVNAIVTLDFEGARDAARQSENRWHSGEILGPLDGVPITVKDNIPVRGMPATWGSKLYVDFIPTCDELPIARLRAGGVIVLGKTNCPEFTLQGYTDNLLFGPTRNPWNPELTPGGSSGGAVAAVSAGLGPIAIGTDGGGSIRRPASHTGLVGLKPSRGRVPRCNGFPATLLDFETVGPIARTVADVVLTMEAISDYDSCDPLSEVFANRPFEVPAPLPRRILYVPRFGTSPVDPEIADSVQKAARALEALGHNVEEGTAPFDIDAVSRAWPVFSQVGLAWLIGSRADMRGKVTAAIEEMANSGLEVSAVNYYSALNAVQTLRCALSVFFTRYDLIMTPAAAALPWPATEVFPTVIAGEKVGPRGHAVFTAFANMADCPGISLPASHSSNGLPIGFQLVAAPGNDGLLCSIGFEYESMFRWSDRWPTI